MFPFDLAENTQKPMAFRKTSENQWFSDVFRRIKRERWEEKS